MQSFAMQLLVLFLLLLTGGGLYYFLRGIIRLIFKIVFPSEFLNRVYLNNLQEHTKSRFNTATEKSNADDAWAEVALSKIRELGLNRPYAKKEENLRYLRQYFKAVTKPNRKLLSELITILPNQHKLNFQTKIACLICDASAIALTTNGNGTEEKSWPVNNLPTLKKFLEDWQSVFTIWLVGLIVITYLICSIGLDNFSAGLLAFAPLCFYLIMALPILKAPVPNQARFRIMGVIAAIVLGGLWLYADVFHRYNQIKTEEIDLSHYGYQGKISFDYPQWLKEDDLSKCEQHIMLNYVEQAPEPVSVLIYFKPDVLESLDPFCKLLNRPTDITGQPSGLIYIKPQSISGLTFREVEVLPKIMDKKQQQWIEIQEVEMSISLENPIWGIFKKLTLGGFGGTSVFSLVGYITKKMSKDS